MRKEIEHFCTHCFEFYKEIYDLSLDRWVEDSHDCIETLRERIEKLTESLERAEIAIQELKQCQTHSKEQ